MQLKQEAVRIANSVYEFIRELGLIKILLVFILLMLLRNEYRVDNLADEVSANYDEVKSEISDVNLSIEKIRRD